MDDNYIKYLQGPIETKVRGESERMVVYPLNLESFVDNSISERACMPLE